jgi:hypothetical protein
MTRESRLTARETVRRLPTLRLIHDLDVRRETARVAARAPLYFWNVPASTSSYHHPLCRRERGLWLHTLMLSTVVERLGASRVELGELSSEQLDLAHSAAILHDMRKNGPPEDREESSVSDHETRMARVILETSLLDESVAVAVGSHMGPWYDGPEPETALARLVHDADMVASTETISPGVQGPVPEEFSGMGLEVVEHGRAVDVEVLESLLEVSGPRRGIDAREGA